MKSEAIGRRVKECANSAHDWKEGVSKTLGVDTEFVWRTTYWPRPALIQLNNGNQGFLVDPLSLTSKDNDYKVIEGLLRDSNILKILHAAHDDLIVFRHYFGSWLDTFVDTQIAEFFCGENAQLGLNRLVKKRLGFDLDKSCQGSNWLRRPLSPRQIDYALTDVAYLHDLWFQQVQELMKRGYLNWLEEDMDYMAKKVSRIVDPMEVWRHVPPLSSAPRSMSYLQALCAWRQIYAQTENKTPEHIISSKILAEWAKNPCEAEDQWLKRLISHKIRLSCDQQEFFFSKLRDARILDEEKCPVWPHHRMTKSESMKMVKLKVLLNKVAHDLNLPPMLIGAKRQLSKLVMHRSGRLLEGWRYDVFGKHALEIIT